MSDAAFEAPLPLAVYIKKVQQRLRLHGVFGLDATLSEVADDVVAFGRGAHQKLYGCVAIGFIFVQFAVSEQ